MCRGVLDDEQHIDVFVRSAHDGAAVRVLFWDRNGYTPTLNRCVKRTFKPIAFDATHTVTRAPVIGAGK